MNDQEYSYLKNKVFKLAGLNLDSYKSQQMRRRLEGYIARSNMPIVSAYCRTIEQDRKKLRELLDFLAINVSEFFRDPSPFDYLRTLVLPGLLKRSPRLNIWSAACSGGHEPYSIAIILEEFSSYHRHRILATDIDESALEQARRGGPYTSADVRNVDKRLLHKYFVQTEDGYWITPKIRGRVEVRRHNLLSEPFEKGFDLVVCRNAIIYFSDNVRNKLYEEFYRSLKVDGVLFIGGSEAILQPGTLGFSLLCPSFYRKLPVNVLASLPLKT